MSESAPPYIFKPSKIGLSWIIFVFCFILIQLPLVSQTAIDYYYYVVQGGDTLNGYFDTLHLADGPFEQNIHTVFDRSEIEIFYPDGIEINKDELHLVHRNHYTIRGTLRDGAPSGEWIYALSDFRRFSTCYGGFDWKRVDYTNPDTLSIYYWYGMDRELRSGERVSGYRGDHHEWTYQCRGGNCLIEHSQNGRSWKVPSSELDMVLERICFHGMRELEYLVE